MGGRQSRAIERNIRAELDNQLCSIRNELSSTKSSLGASRNEIESLRQQLSTFQTTQQGNMSTQLHKVVELETRVNSTNARFKASEEQMWAREEFQQGIGKKIHEMIELENKVHSGMFDILSSRSSLEVSNIELNALREQFMSCDKFNQDTEMKLGKVMELEPQLCSINVQLKENKWRLDSEKNDEERLGKEVVTLDNFERDVGIKLQNILELDKQFHLVSSKEILAKECFEAVETKENVLTEQFSGCEEFDKGMELKLRKYFRLEKEISCASNEAIFAEAGIESTKKEVNVLKEEILALEKIQRDIEMNLRLYISSSNIETLCTQKTNLEAQNKK